MKRFITGLFLAVLLVSCDKAEGYYSYLSEPDLKVETVKMKFTVSSAQSVFYYTVQAKEMVVDWGNGTALSEYAFPDDTYNTDSIKALSYTYASAGTYDVEVRALQMKSLLLPQSGENFLTELSLTDCIYLRKLSCENQPIAVLDLSDCAGLATVELDSCPELKNIYLGNNNLLSEVILINNTSLDADALNELFEGLPPVNNDERYITLSGNKGDDTCNKSLATSKGWVFR